MRIKYIKRIIVIVLIISLVFLHSNISRATTNTFGLTTDDASVQTNSTDRKYVYSATPSTSGIVTAGTARVWLSASGTSNAKLVIYSDSAGSPNALLATSDQVAISNTTEQAINFTFTGAQQLAITSGTPYWIGIHFADPGTPNFTISRANVVGLVRSDPDTYADGPADPCACATTSNGGLNIFVTYTEGVADPSPSGKVQFRTSAIIKTNMVIK